MSIDKKANTLTKEIMKVLNNSASHFVSVYNCDQGQIKSQSQQQVNLWSLIKTGLNYYTFYGEALLDLIEQVCILKKKS